MAVEVSERVRQQLREIQSSFPDILAQFLDPSTSPSTVPPATPPAVTPVKPPAASGERGRGSSTTTDRSLSIYSACRVSHTRNLKLSVSASGVPDVGSELTGGQVAKKRRKVSVREMVGELIGCWCCSCV